MAKKRKRKGRRASASTIRKLSREYRAAKSSYKRLGSALRRAKGG